MTKEPNYSIAKSVYGALWVQNNKFVILREPDIAFVRLALDPNVRTWMSRVCDIIN